MLLTVIVNHMVCLKIHELVIYLNPEYEVIINKYALNMNTPKDGVRFSHLGVVNRLIWKLLNSNMKDNQNFWYDIND